MYGLEDKASLVPTRVGDLGFYPCKPAPKFRHEVTVNRVPTDIDDLGKRVR